MYIYSHTNSRCARHTQQLGQVNDTLMNIKHASQHMAFVPSLPVNNRDGLTWFANSYSLQQNCGSICCHGRQKANATK